MNQKRPIKGGSYNSRTIIELRYVSRETFFPHAACCLDVFFLFSSQCCIVYSSAIKFCVAEFDGYRCVANALHLVSEVGWFIDSGCSEAHGARFMTTRSGRSYRLQKVGDRAMSHGEGESAATGGVGDMVKLLLEDRWKSTRRRDRGEMRRRHDGQRRWLYR